jgi:hypothetical protein
MTKQSLALISFALLVCLTAHAAPKKKHASAPPEDVALQEIDVDAMARAKDGKPTDAPAKPADEPTGAAGEDAMPAETVESTEPAPSAESTAAPAEATPATPVSESAPAQAAEAPEAAPNARDAEPPTTSAGASMDRPSPLTPLPAPSDTDKSIAAGCEARATSLLDAAQKGDYAGATRDFDAKMRTALPPPKFKQAWESLTQFGALQARGQPHPMKGDGYIAITIPLIFDKANLYAQVACGSDGRVAGFYIKPL